MKMLSGIVMALLFIVPKGLAQTAAEIARRTTNQPKGA
jgi:hypothetical protein